MEKIKDKNERIIGIFKEQFATHSELKKYIDKPIYQALSFYKHTEKHAKQFNSPTSYFYCLENIQQIVENPDDYIYEIGRKGMHLFKTFEEVNQTAKIIIDINENNELYVATIFPYSKLKIAGFKIKILEKEMAYKPNFSKIKIDIDKIKKDTVH